MSSPIGFFDVIYLAVFIILSPAFDFRFYQSPKPLALVEEVAYALQHFYSFLHRFSHQYIILLEGEAVAASYLLHRMLGEFSAASVVFSQAIFESQQEGDENSDDDDGDDNHNEHANFVRRIEGVLGQSHPQVIPYYSHCLHRGHKDFIWSGPDVQILRRTEALTSIILLTTAGELLDLPGHKIYDLDPATLPATSTPAPPLASALPLAPTPPNPGMALAVASSTQPPSEALAVKRTKRHGRGNSDSAMAKDEQPRKRKR